MTKTSGLNYKNYTGSSEISYDDDCLHGKILFIDDIITYEGATPNDLKNEFIAAVDRYLAYCKKTGAPANKPYSGTFNIRTGSEIHRKACQAAFENNQSLNEFVCESISEKLTKRSLVVEVKENHHHYHQEKNTYDEEAITSWPQKPQPNVSQHH